MNHADKTRRFTELHVKGTPLVLYNAWDTGSAKAILAAGAKAIATSSWAVADAQGYADGEAIPIAFLHQIVERHRQVKGEWRPGLGWVRLAG